MTTPLLTLTKASAPTFGVRRDAHTCDDLCPDQPSVLEAHIAPFATAYIVDNFAAVRYAERSLCLRTRSARRCLFVARAERVTRREPSCRGGGVDCCLQLFRLG